MFGPPLRVFHLEKVLRPRAVPWGAGPALALNVGETIMLDTIATGEDRAIAANFIMARPERWRLRIRFNNGVKIGVMLFESDGSGFDAPDPNSRKLDLSQPDRGRFDRVDDIFRRVVQPHQ